MLALAAGPVLAQDVETPDPTSLSIELNAADNSAQGCTLSFLITNALGSDVTQAVYETVLFDAQGQVDRLTLFDFGLLPAGRPRVRQFTLPDTSCDAIGRILVNGADSCEATELAENACMDRLKLSTRTDIEILG
jgi:hypothetical protein